VLLCLFLFTSCHDDPPKSDASALCAKGGATLSAGNECACPNAQRWNGSRCEPAGTLAAERLNGVDKPSAPPPRPPEPSVTPAPEPEAPPMPWLAAACRKAKAHFDAKDSYCHCSGGDVLINTTCRSFAGQVNQLACGNAHFPGHWLKGHCDCADGKDFIPGRGGCVARQAMSQTTSRRICESSVNRGKWDAARVRCDCGQGRVWSGAVCELQASRPSREVCESGYNGGRWDKDKKRCDCPAGRIWLDQSCRLAAGVDPLAACVSEANQGSWVTAASRCACPRAGRWDAAAKLCR
jgi:hypothetical protein